MKEINQSIVLNIIRNYGPISRADIAKKTKLSSTTVSTLVDDLIKQEYLEEIGEGESSGGRRPILLKFNPASHFVIGVELEGKNISVAVTDLKVNIINKLTEEIKNTDEFLVVDEIINLARQTMEESGVEFEKIIGMGVGATGLIDTGRGVVRQAINLDWKDVPLKDLIEKKFDEIPIYIDNIANVAALGEKWAGAGKKAKNLIYIRIGTGIGAGIILNGTIYEGSNGNAGEIGHITVESNGHRCKCGNRGCLEVLASGSAIIKRAIVEILGGRDSLIKKLTNGSIEKITAKVVADAAKKGDKLSLEIWKETGEYLGIAIANLINIYDPEIVIIGGGVAQAGRLLFEPIRRTVKKRVPGSGKTKIAKIVLSKLGENVSIIGAASLALEKIFKVHI
jgi:glucokinase-like ROK family protein